MARCTKAAQCRARCTNAVAGPGRPGEFAQQALPEQAHLASCHSKCVILPVVCRLHDQCSCQAGHCAGGRGHYGGCRVWQGEALQQALAGACALAMELPPHVQGTRILLQCRQQMDSL